MKIEGSCEVVLLTNYYGGDVHGISFEKYDGDGSPADDLFQVKMKTSEVIALIGLLKIMIDSQEELTVKMPVRYRMNGDDHSED